MSYEHEFLISIFKEGEVLELNQELRDVVLVHKETSKQHEGDNKHGCQGNS